MLKAVVLKTNTAECRIECCDTVCLYCDKIKHKTPLARGNVTIFLYYFIFSIVMLVMISHLLIRKQSLDIYIYLPYC